MPGGAPSALRITAIVCTAQFCAQIGAFAVPALLPTFIGEWTLSSTEAGWITGIYYGAYTLSVPVLASLTDRIDPKRIYLLGVSLTALGAFGFTQADGFWPALAGRALLGVGWAGTYMPGLKALSDFVEGPSQSRAVSAHAASLGISGGLSFIVAGLIADVFGWRAAIGFAGVGAVAAFAIVAFALPPSPRAPDPDRRGWINLRPAFRNRSAVAYSIAYLAHTWEMSALRNWGVAFLTFSAATTGASPRYLVPTAVVGALAILGTFSSVAGNELSIRFGRRRLILAVMALSVAVACAIGFAGSYAYGAAAGLCLLYGALIWADSSSLTAGAVGSADPRYRGATMALHSSLGYLGGFIGPLAIGVVLDLAGGQSALGYGLAFAHLGLAVAIGAAALVLMRPAGLAGDRG